MATTAADVELDLPVPVIVIPNPVPCDFGELSVDLLAGYQIKSFLGADTPFSNCNQIESIMTQLQAALSSIQPIFLIGDVVLAILECVKAVPDCITSLSPQPLFDCLEGLIAAVLALICALYPPFAWPVMIISILAFVKAAIQCVRDNLNALCEGVRRLTNLQELIAISANPELEDILEQTQINLGCQQQSAVGSLDIIFTLLALINGLIEQVNELAGQEVLPVIGLPEFNSSSPCEEIVSLLDTVLDLLDLLQSPVDCKL